MTEIDMIIFTYFFLICHGEYMVSNPKSTLVHLKNTVFSCDHSVFVDTSTEGDQQTTKFATLTFMNQNNSVRGGVYMTYDIT